MPVISVPQEAQSERCSPHQCGARRPTALSITLTEASVLSVPLWHPPQSTERMMNAPSTLTSQSERSCSASLSWTLFVLLSFTRSFSHFVSPFKHIFLPFISPALFLYEVPRLFSPPTFLSSVYCCSAGNKSCDKSRDRHWLDYSILKEQLLNYRLSNSTYCIWAQFGIWKMLPTPAITHRDRFHLIKTFGICMHWPSII